MQKELVDTHCHLYLDDFTSDLDEVLKRAENIGVSRFYMPAIDSSHHKKMVELQKTYVGRCYSMLGLHPCSVREDYQMELDIICKVIERDQFIAIGEIGLDYYWTRDYDAQQMICFRVQIDIARSHHLPIVIHSRNSMEACLEVLKEESKKGISGIFHCFTGTVENALQIIDCGMMLGIGGVVTYKNSGLADVVAQLPLDSLVLETDAPYLTPAPFRGKRNESSYLKYVVEKIASVKNISVDEVAEATTRNANKVFNRP